MTTKATAQMGGLTREEIEFYRAEMKWQMRPVHTFNQIDALCDLALQAIDRWVSVSPIAEYQEHHFKAEDVGVAWNGNRIWVCVDGAALLRAKLNDGKFQVLFSPPPPPERP